MRYFIFIDGMDEIWEYEEEVSDLFFVIDMLSEVVVGRERNKEEVLDVVCLYKF